MAPHTVHRVWRETCLPLRAQLLPPFPLPSIAGLSFVNTDLEVDADCVRFATDCTCARDTRMHFPAAAAPFDLCALRCVT